MKKYAYLGTVRKSICTTDIGYNKENINRSIKSMRSLSKSVRKLKGEKGHLKDWETLNTIQTPTPKFNKYCYLPRIDQLKKTTKMRGRSCKTISTIEVNISSIQETPTHKFAKILSKKTRKLKTLDMSIDIELDRLKSLTQNCSKLLNDLSNIQKNKIIDDYRVYYF